MKITRQEFKANKSSINIKKIKFKLYHNISVKDDIPLKPYHSIIGNENIEKNPSIKFLKVIQDEHKSWKELLKIIL